jgi:hypothetical protein
MHIKMNIIRITRSNIQILNEYDSDDSKTFERRVDFGRAFSGKDTS